MEDELERSLVEEVKRPLSHAHSNGEEHVIDLDKLTRSSVILDQSLLHVNWDPASGCHFPDDLLYTISYKHGFFNVICNECFGQCLRTRSSMGTVYTHAKSMLHGSKVDRRLQSEGLNGTRTQWVTKRRAIESSDGQEKEKQQWLLSQQLNHDQGRSPNSRSIGAFDCDEVPEDEKPSKKRQRTARTPSDASLSGEFTSSSPTYGDSERMSALSHSAEVVSLQSESPIPIINDSKTEMDVPSVDIMDRIIKVEVMLEEQKHEVQWLAMEQRGRFEGLTEDLDESNRLNRDLAAKMSRNFKEQNDWEKTVNARLDHRDSSINAKIADMKFLFQLFRDYTEVPKAKRFDIEKLEKQLARSESLIEEHTTASAMLVEKQREMSHTIKQFEKSRLQQRERGTEAPNEQTALDRIAKVEEVTKEFAKQLRGTNSLIENSVSNNRSGSNDFQIDSLVQSNKIMMMRLVALEEKNEMHVSKIVELERRNERLQIEMRNLQ
ncbi:hypothetical protein BHYA_0214g00100 [Botrytis hyacinthi]|uniref:Uncharacterized protein n=1 Tax=Botrytis hyacinthi TaxID=278943 RepID=A0A4Z1GFX5_9HELO|nr:hypothetical protein BHYA_0214g00100 [Botrytis hyacinthi]